MLEASKDGQVSITHKGRWPTCMSQFYSASPWAVLCSGVPCNWGGRRGDGYHDGVWLTLSHLPAPFVTPHGISGASSTSYLLTHTPTNMGLSKAWTHTGAQRWWRALPYAWPHVKASHNSDLRPMERNSWKVNWLPYAEIIVSHIWFLNASLFTITSLIRNQGGSS